MTNNIHLVGPCFHLLSQYLNGLSTMAKSNIPQVIQTIREKFIHDASLLLHSLKPLQNSHGRDKEWGSDLDVKLPCKILFSFYARCDMKWGMNARHFGNGLYFEVCKGASVDFASKTGSLAVLSDATAKDGDMKKSDDTLQQKKSSMML